MSNDKSKTFSDITPEQMACMKVRGESKSPPVVYTPADALKGIVIIKVTFVGTIELTFEYDSGAKTLAFVIIKKPGIVPIGRIWRGFQDTVDSCR